MVSMAGQLIGPYRIGRKLGEGGMGVVYEAIHEGISRRVAIKVLNTEYARNPAVTARFFNEAKAVNLIEHPSIVQISDHGHAPDGTTYIVMELLKGETLSRRLQQLGTRMSVPQALQIAWQVADALSAAHAHDIIHRDLKPDNIMLVQDPVAPGGERAKLLDFGIAKLAQEGPFHTASNLIMGTPSYMSPEQCRGTGKVDAKTDIYSLGIVLYQMLSGQLPFDAEGAGELIAMQLFQEPPPLLGVVPDLPPALAALVHRLLVKDRAVRPAMATVVAELAAMLANFSSGVVMALTPPQGAPTVKRPRTQLATEITPSTLGLSATQKMPPPRYSRLGMVLFTGGSIAALTLLLPRAFRNTEEQDSAAIQQSARNARNSAAPIPTQPLSYPPSQPQPIIVTPLSTPPPKVVKPPPRVFRPNTVPYRPALPPKPALPAKPGPLVSKNAKTVRWVIGTSPTGAAIFGDDGRFLGYTPWETTQPISNKRVFLRLRKTGYFEKTIVLQTSNDEVRRELLHAMPSL